MRSAPRSGDRGAGHDAHRPRGTVSGVRAVAAPEPAVSTPADRLVALENALIEAVARGLEAASSMSGVAVAHVCELAPLVEQQRQDAAEWALLQAVVAATDRLDTATAELAYARRRLCRLAVSFEPLTRAAKRGGDAAVTSDVPL